MEYRPFDSTGLSAGELRDQIWTMLLRYHVAAYPLPPYGHHPNFSGSSEAAARLVEYLFNESVLSPGQTVLSYPDYVLKPVRKGLLEKGIKLIVPAKYGNGYRLLEPHKVNAAAASSIAGAEKEGLLIKTLPPLDFALIACVALTDTGDSLAKGYGFSLPDTLELKTATIIHPLQQVSSLPESSLQVDFWATPQELFVK